MRALLLCILLAQLAACAPLATGELDRLYDRSTNDKLTQVEGRQDFRTLRQQLPGCVLP
jgi:hypothetical protein